MKDYKDVARSVFRRRNEYLEEKKRKRDTFMKRSAVALSCCLMMLVSFNIWRTDALKTLAPSPDRSQFNVTEANTTAPTATDINGMTVVTGTENPDLTVTTDQNGGVPVQNVTTTANKKGGTVTTTHTKSSKPVRTTDSFMEVTFTKRTSAATTSAHKTSAVNTTSAAGTSAKTTSAKNTTTKQSSGTAAQHTTAKATTTSHRTAEPQRTTNRPVTTSRSSTTYPHTTTRIYTTASAVYSTTRTYATSIYYSTTIHYTTSIRYTTSVVYTTSYSMSSENPIATVSPEPIVATTAAVPTTTTVVYSYTTTSLTGFHWNGNYYKTTGTKIDKSFLKNYLGREYDEDLNTTFYIYAHDGLDPEFMCYASTSDSYYAYLGVNETWKPETLGDIISGADFNDYVNTPYVYDTAENSFHKVSDENAVRELLRSYSGRKVQITGLSHRATVYNAKRDGIEPPSFDLSGKLGYIELRTHNLSAEGHYLQLGYIHITDDGKLEVDLFYLKYTADIGRENAAELMDKLKTI